MEHEVGGRIRLRQKMRKKDCISWSRIPYRQLTDPCQGGPIA
jgi:hypothetical protein